MALLAGCSNSPTIDDYLDEQGAAGQSADEPGDGDRGDPNVGEWTDGTTLSTTASTSSTTQSGPTEKPLIEIPAEWDGPWEEIDGRYLLYWDALLVAGVAPTATIDYPPLAELTSDELYEELQGQIQAWVDTGTWLVDPEDSLTEHKIRLPNTSILTKANGNEVIFQDCMVVGFISVTQKAKSVMTRSPPHFGTSP